MNVIGAGCVLILFLAPQGMAQDEKAAYTKMAPIAQYLMARDAEISIARSAAPKSVSDDAEVLIFTESGFQTAVKGTNGFVCMVARSWSADFDNPDFWDPALRAPICYNALAAGSQVGLTIKRTQVVLAGGTAAQVLEAITAAINSGELPTPEPGSMSFMLSKQTFLDHRVGHWLRHLMFFAPQETDPKLWGAGLPGSPIMGIKHPEEHSTTFLVPLGQWSDGTAVVSEKH
jgi:hypothetical protein